MDCRFSFRFSFALCTQIIVGYDTQSSFLVWSPVGLMKTVFAGLLWLYLFLYIKAGVKVIYNPGW